MIFVTDELIFPQTNNSEVTKKFRRETLLFFLKSATQNFGKKIVDFLEVTKEFFSGAKEVSFEDQN